MNVWICAMVLLALEPLTSMAQLDYRYSPRLLRHSLPLPVPHRSRVPFLFAADPLSNFHPAAPASELCSDNIEWVLECRDWASSRQCELNPEWMWVNCPVSCNRCGLLPGAPLVAPAPAPVPVPLPPPAQPHHHPHVHIESSTTTTTPEQTITTTTTPAPAASTTTTTQAPTTTAPETTTKTAAPTATTEVKKEVYHHHYALPVAVPPPVPHRVPPPVPHRVPPPVPHRVPPFVRGQPFVPRAQFLPRRPIFNQFLSIQHSRAEIQARALSRLPLHPHQPRVFSQSVYPQRNPLYYGRRFGYWKQ